MGGELRAEIAGVTRQMYPALLGQMAVMLGFSGQALGMTFAFSRNKFVGSYLFFSATSRG